MTVTSANKSPALHLMMGGTFDPVHVGHLRMAIELREHFAASHIHLVPCHVPPHRDTPGASSADRVRMLQAAVADEVGLVVDERELRRDAPSYTADTLADLRRELGESQPLALVLGTDAFAGIDRWHQPEAVLERAHLIVIDRPGYPLPEDGLARRWVHEHGVNDVSELKSRERGAVLQLRLSLLDISATDVRERIASGRSPRYLVPDPVWQYIRERGLYRQG
ncbi:nicotinate-nucleotide adenylyltransferase [Marinobacteraceae bacterium S3BR75-40.1]